MPQSKTLVSKKRHVLKTCTWRLLATTDTVLIGWWITGDVMHGLSIGGVEVLTKMGLYYFHERAWYKSQFGITQVKAVDGLKDDSSSASDVGVKAA